MTVLSPLLKSYEARLRTGAIERCAAQREVAERLAALALELESYRRPRASLLGTLLRQRAAPPPKGVYVHGSVGRGKTMLMDMFFEAVRFEPRRRFHFHEFMAEVHERIARGRATTDGDPIPFVASEIAAEAVLLCFDELHVTDIADAMILGRLFKGLFERDVVVVATSNSPPSGLYANGLNRQLFLPFVALIEQRLEVVELDAVKDYRLEKLAGRPLYFHPDDATARRAIDEHWHRLTGGAAGAPTEVEVQGRRLLVPRAAMGVARFAFADLCEAPLGPRDYLHLAHAFHTLVIEGIPVLSPARRNEARRLANLIDTLYDNRVCLIASAAAEPHALYPSGDGAQLFERTASRLTEMRSEAYLADRARRGAAASPAPL